MTTNPPKKILSLFDSVSLLLGVIIGVGIYETSPLIAASLPNLTSLMLVWIIGAAFSLAGALCYVELAAAYPGQAGEYIYLSQAYGRKTGFLFLWSQALIVRPGSIAAMAFPFAHYAHGLFPLSSNPDTSSLIYACLAILLISLINILGVAPAKGTQNLLVLAKVLGIIAIIVVPFFAQSNIGAPLQSYQHGQINFGLALILVLYVFGGWNEIACVAGEVRNSNKHIFLALVIAIGTAMLCYMGLNLAFALVLGFSGMAGSQAVAAETVAKALPGLAATFVSLLICISSLGAINGLIFTGARIYQALANDFLPSAVSKQLGTLRGSVVFQCTMSILIVLLSRSFAGSVVYTTSVVWIFFLAVGLSVFILHFKDAERFKTARVMHHPVAAFIFCLSSAYVIYSAVAYDLKGSLIALGLLALGIPCYKLLSHYRHLEQRP